MSEVLVDSNVLLDIVSQDPTWGAWSAAALSAASEDSVLVINPIIFAEVSVRYERIEQLEAAFPESSFRRDPLPWDGGFLAGKVYLAYRHAGGIRRSPLPDFYVGAHAAIRGMTLLTRDPGRYRGYFPRLPLIAP